MATDEPEEYEILRDKWKRAFQISEKMADFMLDNDFKFFQEERRTV